MNILLFVAIDGTIQLAHDWDSVSSITTAMQTYGKATVYYAEESYIVKHQNTKVILDIPDNQVYILMSNLRAIQPPIKPHQLPHLEELHPELFI
jgi:hypothetical protein